MCQEVSLRFHILSVLPQTIFLTYYAWISAKNQRWNKDVASLATRLTDTGIKKRLVERYFHPKSVDQDKCATLSSFLILRMTEISSTKLLERNLINCN